MRVGLLSAPSPGLRIHGYRWVVLAAYACATAANQLAWISFAPFRDATASLYAVRVEAVDALSIVYYALFLPLALPATWVLTDGGGLRAGVLLGAWLTAAGCVLRSASLLAFSRPSYAALFIGQSLAAIGQVLLLGAPPAIASAWFPPTERATACTIGTVAATIGIAAGMVAPLVLGSDDARAALAALLHREGAATLCAALALAVALPSAPPMPPSHAAATERPRLRIALRAVVRTRGAWALACALALPLAAFNALATLIDAVADEFGFGAAQASRMGGAVVVAGLGGCALVAVLADRTAAHVPLLRGCLAAALGAALALPAALGSGSEAVATLTLASLGFCLMPTLPLAFELAAESTFPAPEAVASSLLMAIASAASVCTTLGGSALLRAGAVRGAVLAFATCIGLGLSAALSFDGALHRLCAERAESERLASAGRRGELEPIAGGQNSPVLKFRVAGRPAGPIAASL